MHTNNQLRESLLSEAEFSFVGLTVELNKLFDTIAFYLERYPIVSTGDYMRTSELHETIKQLGQLPKALGDVLMRMKKGEERILSRLGTELTILNEIWANVQALHYFFTSNDIDLEPFNLDQASEHHSALVRINRLLT